MVIPDPVAFPEDRALVRNYRMRPAQWEEGEVRGFRFTPAHVRTDYEGGAYEVPCHWSFDVWVERPVVEGLGRYGRSKGGGYMLNVGADALEAVEE